MMFQKNRRRGLKRAIDEARDVEMRQLRDDVSARQDRIAQLELELFDTRSEIALFERELDQKLGFNRRRLAELEKMVGEARRKAAFHAQWGHRADSNEVAEDVVEQFERRWRKVDRPAMPAPKKELSDGEKEELKTIFRGLAKQFHPDLASSAEEKVWREERMTRLNEAYRSQDIGALNKLAQNSDWHEEPAERTREEEMAHLEGEIRRLDGILRQSEKELQDLINSPTTKLMLDAAIARKEGRDLLSEMEQDLHQKIRSLEEELTTLSH